MLERGLADSGAAGHAYDGTGLDRKIELVQYLFAAFIAEAKLFDIDSNAVRHLYGLSILRFANERSLFQHFEQYPSRLHAVIDSLDKGRVAPERVQQLFGEHIQV